MLQISHRKACPLLLPWLGSSQAAAHHRCGHLLSESILQRGLVLLCAERTKFGEETFWDKGKS